MADTYNYAYDHRRENAYAVPFPPRYDTSIIGQQQPPSPRPTVSSIEELTPNTVNQTSSPSSTQMCRMFLIIISSLIIGGVIGGTISYLATSQGSVCGSSGINIITPTRECPTCPTGQTCPTISATGPVEDTSKLNVLTNSSECPTCHTSRTCSTCHLTDFPIDCQEVMDQGNMASGEYMISPFGVEAAFPVWCDMQTDGGGWTVFQRRRDGSVDFFRGWFDYTNGFGDVNSEHWLGNQKIHQITSQGVYALRIDMADFEGNTAYAEYSNFKVGDLDSKYKLTVYGYSGDAGDSLLRHTNTPFSTKDVDNDNNLPYNCAGSYVGAWWYYSGCITSNLNGRYNLSGNTTYGNGLVWSGWKGYYYSLKISAMKMRRIA